MLNGARGILFGLPNLFVGDPEVAARCLEVERDSTHGRYVQAVKCLCRGESSFEYGYSVSYPNARTRCIVTTTRLVRHYYSKTSIRLQQGYIKTGIVTLCVQVTYREQTEREERQGSGKDDYKTGG